MKNDYLYVHQDKPRHQIWVTEESQDRARARRPKVRTRNPCPKCGALFANRKLAAHKAECRA